MNFLKNKIRKIFIERKHSVIENNIKLFTVRKFGGSTGGRASSIFDKEPETIQWIKSFKENSCLIDIGANIGIYSLYAAANGHKVLALEPESSNYFQINLNIKDNNFDNLIKAYCLSADTEFGFGNLNLSNLKIGGSGHNFINKNKESESNKKNKSLFAQGSLSIDIDNLLLSTNFTPNYIKIDVDGNERKIINGMKKALKNSQLRSLLIEIDNSTSDNREILDIMKVNNFKISNKGREGKTINYIFDKQ